MKKVFTLLLRMYQWFISPLFPRTCRYAPSCSHYAIKAFTVHGVLRGCILSAWRVLRCNPFLQGGYDPVPRKHHMTDAFLKEKGDHHE